MCSNRFVEAVEAAGLLLGGLPPPVCATALKWLFNLLSGLARFTTSCGLDACGRIILELDGPRVGEIATRSRVPVMYEVETLVCIRPYAGEAEQEAAFELSGAPRPVVDICQ